MLGADDPDLSAETNQVPSEGKIEVLSISPLRKDESSKLLIDQLYGAVTEGCQRHPDCRELCDFIEE